MLLPRMTCREHTDITQSCLLRKPASALHSKGGGGEPQRLASSIQGQAKAGRLRTTMPMSVFSFSSTALSSTMFMNWSKPRSTPVTCRFALRETGPSAHTPRHCAFCI